MSAEPMLDEIEAAARALDTARQAYGAAMMRAFVHVENKRYEATRKVADMSHTIMLRDETIATLTRERDEARAEVDKLSESAKAAWEAECVMREQRDRYHAEWKQERQEVERLRAEADRWKRSCNVFRERDWPKAFQATVTSLEQEVSDAHEQLAKFRRLSKPWEGTAYRRGAEAMRAKCEQIARHACSVIGKLEHTYGIMTQGHIETVSRLILEADIPEEP